MHAFEARFHAEIGAEALETLHGQRIAVGQRHLSGRQNVSHGRGAVPIDRIALVELRGFPRHARERVAVYLGGVRRHMRDASRGEAGDHALREQRKVRQCQEPAIALAKRRPPSAAEFGAAQVLEIADDRIGEEMLQERRALGAVHRAHHMRVDARRASGAALVGQHHAEMPDGLGDPTVGIRA